MVEAPAGSDTIRILVSTDNHVGYNERDPIRGDDSAEAFDEVMSIAQEKSVDMVLLAGDLFHENKPSRKSMNHVMRSLRKYCYGDRPCELEMLSDPSEHFDATFDHANYEDPDINVAIPVFSIHGNHDDPSGEGHLAALDLLQTCGLINYYGKTPESDNIVIKPILLQKGRTKLALYGMSNVRDERLFRTFRDGKVRFFRPNAQKQNWFNLMSVHQNHHAYTETGYLPENFLPEFLDLVVWGHEHECLIEPRYNPEMSFHVMQPGSSVATSLVAGEAVAKHVAILEITGEKFVSNPVRLKTVRPFIMREIVLQEEKGMKSLSKKDNNRSEITRHLIGVVEQLIGEARANWHSIHNLHAETTDGGVPLPLIRLRVEYTAPEGGKFDCENPQRFSNRFVGKVANTNDVVQFHKKKNTGTRNAKTNVGHPAESNIAQLTIDTVKVEKLVREFLTAQSLTILPQNSFGDAVSQFVDKDDRHAMQQFVEESLTNQIKHLLEFNRDEEEDITTEMYNYRSKLEELFASGSLKRLRNSKLKPKPVHWDSDIDGEWAEQPGAIVFSEVDDDDDVSEDAAVRSNTPAARGRSEIKATTPQIPKSTKSGKAAKSVSKANATRGQKAQKSKAGIGGGKEEVIIVADDDGEDEDGIPQGQPASAAIRATAKSSKASLKKPPTRSTRASGAQSQQTKLSFSHARNTQVQTGEAPRVQYELSDDEISDDDDAFEPVATTTRSKARK